MMKTLCLVVRPILVAAACASIAACADNPPRQTDMDYRSRPSSTTQGAKGTPGSSGQRLTIQSGEGERLNLPWFIDDTKDWINSN
ncbi:type IV pilus biogenesis protein CpaD/CtpE [Achromobacter deleyi]|jgi:type IV pilus biogenesis protein CpaD/CtpE|nr:type IV pilus biogenesis protein CpaD/CtpE [Achromobacter deleyi]